MKAYENFVLNGRKGEVTKVGIVHWDGCVFLLSEIAHPPLAKEAYDAYDRIHDGESSREEQDEEN